MLEIVLFGSERLFVVPPRDRAVHHPLYHLLKDSMEHWLKH
jgi:hypothetical protein